jgi:hypothetical protein
METKINFVLVGFVPLKGCNIRDITFFWFKMTDTQVNGVKMIGNAIT